MAVNFAKVMAILLILRELGWLVEAGVLTREQADSLKEKANAALHKELGIT